MAKESRVASLNIPEFHTKVGLGILLGKLMKTSREGTAEIDKVWLGERSENAFYSVGITLNELKPNTIRTLIDLQTETEEKTMDLFWGDKLRYDMFPRLSLNPHPKAKIPNWRPIDEVFMEQGYQFLWQA